MSKPNPDPLPSLRTHTDTMTDSPQPCPQQYFMALQNPQLAPSFNRRPLPGQPSSHASILQDHDVFPSTHNVAGDRQVDRDWEGMRPPVENPTAQDKLQHRDHLIPDYARVAQDIPTQTHVTPPAPVFDAFHDDVQRAAGGPALAFLDEVPHQEPVPNGRATEMLRQLALLYFNDPNSQLAAIRMEPDHADGVTVVITLKLTNL